MAQGDEVLGARGLHGSQGRGTHGGSPLSPVGMRRHSFSTAIPSQHQSVSPLSQSAGTRARRRSFTENLSQLAQAPFRGRRASESCADGTSPTADGRNDPSPPSRFRRFLGGGGKAVQPAGGANERLSPRERAPERACSPLAIPPPAGSTAEASASSSDVHSKLDARLSRLEGGVLKAMSDLRQDLVLSLKMAEDHNGEALSTNRRRADERFNDIEERLETVLARIGSGAGEHWMSGMR